ncbi:hypothetical protein STSP2_00538 [Anaerohalosphaera lusitana]|uniref:Uncharacterized protein n=1 Tax=Anaerohalosphaera lusitana TaxID=1936003 RepID=A0A1U9NI42_9BACT|nr:hypothetical protein [Anaerohalosphaera lusitana]AQT67394.1 hypothetical protein STSP2_00538 [Anaerohalosphaera lusitana]
MDTYLYLSVIPESLVMSMLGPEEFGTYLAVGTQKRSKEHAIFFELDKDFKSDYFDLDAAREKCKPHDNGEPKHSVYVSIYRVLEHIPLDAVKDIYLVTNDGRVLKLPQASVPSFDAKYHLYQELAPVHPLIASNLHPPDFRKFITDPSTGFSVPKICFVDLRLGDLAEDCNGSVRDLPYKNIEHLRDCLANLGKDKNTKTVDRIFPQHVPYRMVASGFYLGDQQNMLFYPFPTEEQFRDKYHDWWRSATLF